MVKLTDFRSRLRREPTPAPIVGRHPSGAMFVGIDHGVGPDRTVISTFRRSPDGTLTLVAAGAVHKLHAIDSPEVRHDHLAKELIERRAASELPYALGWSFMDRYVELTNSTWMNNDGIPEEQLVRVMTDIRGMPNGRVVKGVKGERVGAGFKALGVTTADYLLFIDNAFRPPTLFRYLKTGVEYGRPVIYAMGDNSGSVHVGHGQCFYPAETVPCFACKEAGIITEETAGSFPSSLAKLGADCPTCFGLTRVWRAKPWCHPEATEARPLTFADANPKKWRGKRI